MQVDGDSLLIQDADCLTGAGQYCLCQLTRYHLYRDVDVVQIKKLDMRVMVTTSTPLKQLLAGKRTHRDLYYLLSGMTLTIPPFQERPEDLRQKLEDCLREDCERYACCYTLIQGTWAVLLTCPWPGDLFQTENFRERLILTADRGGIGKIMVAKCLRSLYPEIAQQAICPVSDGYKITTAVTDEHQISGRVREICQTLRHYDGSRQKTVETLGISRAILWRKMKKYGIEFR